jgi:hypothetical protein
MPGRELRTKLSKQRRKLRTWVNSQVTRDAFRIDTDGSVHNSSDMALHVDTARGNLISTDSNA